MTDNAAEWLRYLDRGVRKAERRVQERTDALARYTGARSLTALTDDDLDNYARGLQSLRDARRDLRAVQETRETAAEYMGAV